MRKLLVYITFLIIVLITANSVFSQQVNSNTELKQQISVEVTHHQLTDSLVFPAAIKGKGVKFTYAILRSGLKRKTALAVAYEQTDFGNENLQIKQHSFSLNFSDGFNVLAGKNKSISAFIGYAINMNPSYTSGNDKSKNGYSWNSSSMLSFYQSYVYSWKKQSVNVDIVIPVAGAVYRPKPGPVYPDDKNLTSILTSFYSNPSFASFHNYRSINISMSYQCKITERFNVAAQYNFNYRKWNDENSFEDKSHAAALSLIYNVPK